MLWQKLSNNSFAPLLLLINSFLTAQVPFKTWLSLIPTAMWRVFYVTAITVYVRKYGKEWSFTVIYKARTKIKAESIEKSTYQLVLKNVSLIRLGTRFLLQNCFSGCDRYKWKLTVDWFLHFFNVYLSRSQEICICMWKKWIRTTTYRMCFTYLKAST